MRKLMMFVLVLALVFSLSSVMFAEDVDAVPNHGGGNLKHRYLNVALALSILKQKFLSMQVSKSRKVSCSLTSKKVVMTNRMLRSQTT